MFKFRYGYDAANAPADREAYKKFLGETEAAQGRLRSPERRGLVPRGHRQRGQAGVPRPGQLWRQAPGLLRIALQGQLVRRSPRRGRDPGQEDLRDHGVVASVLRGYSAGGSAPCPISSSLASIARRPSPRSSARSTSRARSPTRSRAVACPPRVPVLRPARLRQDHASRASSARRSTARRWPSRHAPSRAARARVHEHRQRQRGRLPGDGRRVEPRHRCDPRAHRGGALPARGAAQEGLRHRRSPHAHDRGVQRAAEDARGAAAARRRSCSRRPSRTSCRTRSCRAASATTSSSSRRRASRSTSRASSRRRSSRSTPARSACSCASPAAACATRCRCATRSSRTSATRTITEAHVAEVLGVADRSLTRSARARARRRRCRRGARGGGVGDRARRRRGPARARDRALPA